ncbi:hypothetical protein [Andreprevotia chitinilytica]|uniref:hypothetical protein n=1 Tax=Andreprevotia chitinilytica TaxID=396808 RepID=UPI0012EC9CB9|nr:hypothetical protein [Andreprevotia chitinilytica]
MKQTTQLTQRQIERLALQRLVFERIRLCAKRYGETPDEMLEWVRSQVMPNPEP